jgi:hypothetical protein
MEASCFPGLDGKLDLRALSPRHLEACATRTAQVLVEGDYNGVLTAGRHYLALERDFSNLDAVLDQLASERERERLAASAYEDVVAAGGWTYRRLVEDVETVLTRASPSRAVARPAVAVSRALDAASKPLLPLAFRVLMPLRRRLYGLLRIRGYGAAEQKA